jgi:hypothetical protein
VALVTTFLALLKRMTAEELFVSDILPGMQILIPDLNKFLLNSNGSSDIYICIFNSSGTLIKAESVGGPGGDLADGLAITESNSIVITGHFADSVDFDPGPGVQWQFSKGHSDIFILQLNADAQWEWIAALGSAENENGNAVEIDPKGNIVVAGELRDDIDMDPGPGENYLSSNSSTHSIFLLKLDSLGQFRWARNFPIYDLGFTRMKLDTFGCIYLIGSFQAIHLQSPSSDIYLDSKDQDDVLIMKIDTSGEWMWINPLHSSGYAIARDIALKGFTDIYVTGHFSDDLDLDPYTGEALIDIPSETILISL